VLAQSPLIYNTLNKTLIDDADEAMLKKLAVLLRGLSRALQPGNQPEVARFNLLNSPQQKPEVVVTLRGSYAKATDFQVGTWYRFPMLVASSLKLQPNFLNPQNGKSLVIEFTIPKDCMNAGYIEGLSWFAGEEEYLLPPYTAAHCTAITNHHTATGTYPKVQFLVAKDNVAVEQEFESQGATTADSAPRAYTSRNSQRLRMPTAAMHVTSRPTSTSFLRWPVARRPQTQFLMASNVPDARASNSTHHF
jgi:hypothetical protein